MHIRIVDVISLLGFVSNASTVCSDIVCSEQLIFGTYIRNRKSIHLCSVHSTSVHLACMNKAQMFRI